MEVLNVPNKKGIESLFRNSLLSSSCSIKTRNTRSSFRFSRVHSKTQLKPARSLSFPFPNRSNFQISAHFGRPTNRRNSLRKKLTENQQVNHNPTYVDTNFNFESTKNNIEQSDNLEDAGYDTRRSYKLSEPSIVENSKALGDSVLWNKLENWVDQYKKDMEFWGIGFNPIFTIFQDSAGDVDRVLVNEEEITRRSGIEETQANSKILHAKRMAKEIETGTYMIPKNSSVAKFVNLSGKTGFISRIQSVTLNPEKNFKLSRVGFISFCGFLVIYALNKLFFSGKKDNELSREEKEMMRRKFKSRMEKEKTEKGSVEVLQDSLNPQILSTRRPQLDKQELMNNILNTNASENMYSQYSSTSQNKESVEFDKKIQEIRELARLARENERSDSSVVNENLTDNISGNEDSDGTRAFIENVEPPNSKSETTDTNILFKVVTSAENGDIRNPSGSNIEVLDNNVETITRDINNGHNSLPSEEIRISDSPQSKPCLSGNSSIRTYPRIIRSVKEAEEYLSLKNEKQKANKETEISDISTRLSDIHDDVDFTLKKIESEEAGGVSKAIWMENNFHELEPVIKKIGVGFKDNYMVARETISDELNLSSEMAKLELNEDDGELEWMKDDKLREIVFQVRENELAGREPFYLMDDEDKVAFFKGLEEKVEKENESLLNLHKYIHSNIENLDYGADGISIYDPPEKIIPRWKGPLVGKDPEFLNHFFEQRNSFVKNDERNSLPKSEELLSHENFPTSSLSSAYSPKSGVPSVKSPRNPKTIIESSDGSIRAGKKSGKEYWEHTKKWSRGFWESYNAESDPEVKSVMKDIGKDLDRWITEKEIEKAAEFMTKIPKRKQRFIERKVNKLKREIEMFGPQAVVSKYSEYAEEEEEDYLWWLDLPFVLCIELYTNNNGEQRIGFYSLEMAEDLELEPKPRHVIAFEDTNDCKNLCYIIQAHMEILGNGNSFIVARPPKDAFREAKANGFGVTVIRKGEMKLNVDQTLEEVEENITEIGSKVYHDMIMRKRSLDTSSLMKGVLRADRCKW